MTGLQLTIWHALGLWFAGGFMLLGAMWLWTLDRRH